MHLPKSAFASFMCTLALMGCSDHSETPDAADVTSTETSTDVIDVVQPDAFDASDASDATDVVDVADASDASDTNTDVPNSDGGSDCTGAETLTAIQTQILDVRCATSRCHSAGFRAGELDLSPGTSFHALVGVTSMYGAPNVRVQPGDVTGSFLWRKLTNDLPSDNSLGAPMPTGEAIRWIEIPADELRLVRCWIAAGAHNN